MEKMKGYIGDEASIESRAKVLFNTHYYIIQDDEKAKKCANSSIDHILNTVGYLVDSNEFIEHFIYWEKVRQKIERL